MSSTPPPQYTDDATDISRFDDLIAYASTHGPYLLQDSQFQLFDTTYENSQTLNAVLSQFTIPIATQNIQAIRQLRSLQISNLRQANRAYDRLNNLHPHLLQRIHQEHYSGQRDTPSPMRITTPPTSPPPIPISNNNSTRTNQRRRNQHRQCFTCQQTSHVRRNCPRYRCQNCHHFQPGHLTRDCPELSIIDHEYDFGHDYDPDNNLNGEQ
jgi:hypothetical protein